MLFAANGLIGCPVKASDGDAGTVKDFLFDDRKWLIRWMVIDTGHWLAGRKILIHPSAIAPLVVPAKPALPMMTPGETLTVTVNVTRAQIESSPRAPTGERVTHAPQEEVYDYYQWDPVWAASGSGAQVPDPSEWATVPVAGRDPHVGGVAKVKGFVVQASDGDLGPVENVLSDSENWDVRYLVVATHRWLSGKEVQLSPHAVTEIDWTGRRVYVNVTREQVRSAPAWDPLTYCYSDEMGSNT